jgi:hypothetical protein
MIRVHKRKARSQHAGRSVDGLRDKFPDVVVTAPAVIGLIAKRQPGRLRPKDAAGTLVLSASLPGGRSFGVEFADGIPLTRRTVRGGIVRQDGDDFDDSASASLGGDEGPQRQHSIVDVGGEDDKPVRDGRYRTPAHRSA